MFYNKVPELSNLKELLFLFMVIVVYFITNEFYSDLDVKVLYWIGKVFVALSLLSIIVYESSRFIKDINNHFGYILLLYISGAVRYVTYATILYVEYIAMMHMWSV